MIAIAGLGFAFYALNIDFITRGDGAMYADYVVLGKFDELTLHIGYYLLNFALDRTVGTLLRLPTHEVLVWVNVAAGAITLGIVYLLAFHFLRTRREALICVLLFAVSGRVLTNATTSEIYMVQTLLVLGSFLLFVRGHVAGSGVLAGAAMLVSPLSAFAFLFFPVYDYQRAGGVRWKVLAILAAAGAAVYVPFVVVYWREMLWGHRGLLDVNAGVPFDPVATLTNFPLYQFKHYTVLLLLLIPAIRAFRRERRLLVLTAAVAVPHAYIILKLTSEDNTFLLNTDLFFALWLAIGWRELYRLHVGRWLGPLTLVAHVGLYAAAGVIFRFDFNRSYAAEMRHVAQQYLVGRDAIMVSDWSVNIGLTYFGRDAATTTIERDPLFRQMYDIYAPERMHPDAFDVSEIYLLDPWSAGPLVRFLASEEQLRRRTEANSIRITARGHLGLTCTMLGTRPHPLYHCTRDPSAREGVSPGE